MPSAATTLSAKLQTALCYDAEDVRRLKLVLAPGKPTRPAGPAHSRKNSAVTLSDTRSSRATSSTSRDNSKTSYTASTHTTLTRPLPRSAKSENDTESVTPQQRHRVAVDAVNGCLRILAVASVRLESPSDPANAPSNSSRGTTLHTPRKASETHVDPSRRSTVEEHGPSELSREQLVITTEVGRYAFEYLQSAEGRHARYSSESDAQVQGGLISFVSKLLSLGLHEQALKQLRALQNVLRHASNAVPEEVRRPTRFERDPPYFNPTENSSGLADLLCFEVRDVQKPKLLSDIVSHQLLSLRLIVASTRVSVLSVVLHYVDLSYKSSPVNILVQLYELDPANPRTLLQLDSLSKILAHTAQRMSHGQSADFERVSLALKMITLALRVRLIWVGLADHECDYQTDILLPFSRVVAIYAKVVSADHMHKYKLARKLYHELVNQATATVEDGRNQIPPDDLVLDLSRMAQDAGLFHEAQELSKTLTASPQDDGKVSAAEFVEIARLATFTLANNEHTEWDQVDRAVKMLNAGLNDESSSLGSVMREALKLRAAAYMYIKKTLTSAATQDILHRECVVVAYQTIVSFLVLLSRVLGQENDEDSSGRQRMILAALRVMKQSMEATCNVTKQLMHFAWMPVDLLLQGIALCKHLLQASSSFDVDLVQEWLPHRDTNSLKSELAKLSWSIPAGPIPDPLQTLRSLKQGLSILDDTDATVRRSAMQAVGHYRFGRALLKLHRRTDARLSFEKSIRSCVATGILADAAKIAEHQPTKAMLKSHPESQVLHAALKGLLEIDVKSEYVDEPDLAFVKDQSSDEKALVYELCLSILCSMMASQDVHFKMLDAASEISRLLLRIYEQKSYPLRRCRLMSRLMRLRAERRELKNVIDLEAVNDILCFSGHLARDEQLSTYWDHYRSTLSASLGLSRGSQGVKQIKSALETWTHLIKGASSWEDIDSRIDEPEQCMAQLCAIADFMDTQGLDEHRAQALALVASAEALSDDGALIRKPPRTVDVAAHLSQLGYTNEAGRYLDVATILMGLSDGTSPHADLVRSSWLLARSETGKSEEILSALRRKISEEGERALANFDVPKGVPCRARHILSFCDILFLCAEISFQTRGCGEALLFSKRAVYLLDRIWKSLEAKQDDDTTLPQKAVDDIDALTEHLTRLSVSRNSDLAHERARDCEVRGPLFWPLTGRLFRTLMQLSKISKLSGIDHAATAAASQAHAIARAVRSRPYIARSLLEMADIARRRGDMPEFQELLDSARSLYSKFPRPTREDVALQLCYADLHRAREDWVRENHAYDKALRSLASVQQPEWLSEIQELPPLRVQVDEDAESSSALSESNLIETSSPAKSAKQWLEQQQVHQRTKLEVGRLTPTPIARQVSASFEISSDPFEMSRSEILRRRAESLIMQGDVEGCGHLLSSQIINEGQPESRASQNALQVLFQLRTALAELSTHAVFGMLPESTLSLPAVPLTRSVAPVLDKNPGSPVKIKALIAGHARSGSKATNAGQLASMQTLQRCLSSLVDSSVFKLALCSNASISRLQDVLTTSSMLLSAAAQGQATQHPASLAYDLDLAKSFRSVRIQAALEVDLAIKDLTSTFDWPDSGKEARRIHEETSRAPEFDLSNTLPPSWTVISFNLREDEGHLFITKYSADRTPFVMRLPLSRQSGDELDEGEESFSFAESLQELQNIIEASDDSISLFRDNPDAMKVKGAKTAWWEQREALDARLGNLLANIEGLWFGGFRGIFSQAVQNKQALERFRQTFETCLSQHLPSRQAHGKRLKTVPVKLDDNILELFLGLISVQDDEQAELDEALADLLYFVVDVLQFNGETNAYDEIDFDAMTVEVQEALEEYRHYQLAASIRNPLSDSLVLILDKRLHGFPWESMPCLSNRSVSRLPSLIELRDRLHFMQSQHSQTSEGITVSTQRGTYILNPSGDLVSTQERFEKVLQNLTEDVAWNGVVGREPSEDEFSAALVKGISDVSLSSRSILVYIGHGSGRQFIRSRTIQRLRAKGCNAALLFGCSSALLKVAGEFEPNGEPRNYLLAGAPAVLGSLWDVTDGDLDKFAASTLETWGLLPKGACKKSEAGSSKSRASKSRQQQQQGLPSEEDEIPGLGQGAKSLTDAAAKARESCYLKFLNGAAMVVYGVPLYLDTARE